MTEELTPTPKRVKKVGRNTKGSELRYRTFVDRYLVNGNNACEAARHAGYSEGTAKYGIKLMRNPRVIELLGQRAERAANVAELSADKWAKEMASIAHFDPGELYDGDGNLIPLPDLPEHVRRAIGSIDIETRMEGKGDEAVPVTTTKVKVWDKNVALANVGKHLGLFEKDNSQKVEPIHVTVTFVGKINGPDRRPSLTGETPVLDGVPSLQSSLRRA